MAKALDKMTDKERILLNIIEQMNFTMSLGRKDPVTGIWTDYRGDLDAQFVSATYGKDHLLTPGALVFCSTSRPFPWKIARYVSTVKDKHGNISHYVLRELGSDRLCNMSNESLSVLVGVPEQFLYEGHQKKVFDWCHKAIFDDDSIEGADGAVCRCGGVEFVKIDGKDEFVRIWIRPHIFGVKRWVKDPDGNGITGHQEYQMPYPVEFPFRKNLRYKDIISALVKAGFPKREFVCSTVEPTCGMGGQASIKVDDVLGVLKNAGITVIDKVAP